MLHVLEAQLAVPCVELQILPQTPQLLTSFGGVGLAAVVDVAVTVARASIAVDAADSVGAGGRAAGGRTLGCRKRCSC